MQWHAHDALMNKATASAARLRRASYGIALAVAGVNYSHFSDDWRPTAGAVVFGIFSAAQPWLWGLHTRRAQHMQLLREGQADTCGATFSAERFRNFPVRTFMARRWSIDHSVADPHKAWVGYKAERARRAGQPTAEQKVALLVALSNLQTRQRRDDAAPDVADTTSPQPGLERVDDEALPPLDEHGLSLLWQTAPPASPAAFGPTRKPSPTPRPRPATGDDVDHDLAQHLIAQQGLGKVRLMRELDITEHRAKKLIEHYRPTNGSQVTS